MDLIDPVEVFGHRVCAWCATPIEGRRQKKFCSGRCTVAHWRFVHRDVSPCETRSCEWCYADLPDDARPTQLYCNAACKQAAWRAGCSAGESREERDERRARSFAAIRALAETITTPRNV